MLFTCQHATFVRLKADPDLEPTFYFDVHPDPDLVKLGRVNNGLILSFFKDCSKFFRFFKKAFLIKHVCNYNSKLINCINLQSFY
jgi:hypothetical protein